MLWEIQNLKGQYMLMHAIDVPGWRLLKVLLKVLWSSWNGQIYFSTCINFKYSALLPATDVIMLSFNVISLDQSTMSCITKGHRTLVQWTLMVNIRKVSDYKLFTAKSIKHWQLTFHSLKHVSYHLHRAFHHLQFNPECAV